MAKNYQSEITQFINKYKADHPGADERQRMGRAIWWDRQVDSESLDGFRAARVPQDPYVYYQNDEKGVLPMRPSVSLHERTVRTG